MVGRWGMSDEIGPVAVIPPDARGPYLPGVSEVSAHTQEVIDAEVRRVVEDAYKDVLALLTENRDRLDSLAAALLEHETLDEDAAYAAAGVEHSSDSAPQELATVAPTSSNYRRPS